MPKLNTTSVSLAVTPTVVSTLFSHFLNRKPLKERPTAHLSYDEGLHLVRSFLAFASQHTVEELQAFTAQWVPHPQWIKVEEATISEEHLKRSAELLNVQLGPDGVRQVGGPTWWQWRKPGSTLKAEWIEMKSHREARKTNANRGKRVMLYVHGGAYFFGSVDEHRYQMQRHARKLGARVFAPKYRLSPQFPFPCGLQDCIAAYLHLLTVQDPSDIIVAGDSAGGGMVMSLLCVLRDQGIPLPAGGVLLSPWVDLAHSFPSVGLDAPMDYIPQDGFHHKPSRSWPPPNEDDEVMLQKEASKLLKGAKKPVGTHKLEEKQQAPIVPADESTGHPPVTSGGLVADPDKFLTVEIDGKEVVIKDQIQMYTTNELLNHPLVSPIMQPSLGGLPPLLIMVGGGEILRDEQIYLAHKCANPTKYALPSEALTEQGKALLDQYKPTDVQLQVWEDLCHVAPTLSFTRPAKYMYRSVAQFGAWALARAQNRGIEIMDDDAISIISTSSGSGTDEDGMETDGLKNGAKDQQAAPGDVGKAGDPLPAFKNHMIRQRVTRHGKTHPLGKETDLPGCSQKQEDIGLIKAAQLRKWLKAKREWDHKFATTKAKVHKKTIKDMATGYQNLTPGEHPPPTALVGRVRADEDFTEKGRVKSVGLALWSLWGSKHDETTVQREQDAAQAPAASATTPSEGQGARAFSDIESQQPAKASEDRPRAGSKTVHDEHQTGHQPLEQSVDEQTPVAQLIEQRKEQEKKADSSSDPPTAPETGVAGKRPFIDGIAMPFSLNKEPDTASMMTLQSGVSPAATPRPLSLSREAQDYLSQAPVPRKDEPERPGIESFVTAQEDLPRVNQSNDQAKALP